MFYQLELRNTPVPTPSELLEFGAEGKACWVNVFDKFVDVNFTIEDLAAET